MAHGADFALQLALNSLVTKSQLDRLLAAVASQCAPSGTAYRTGEPSRLARPVLFAAQRGVHDEAEWKAWFERVLAPAPLASWAQAFASEAGLAKRHNPVAFLQALYVEASESEDAGVRLLLAAVRDGLKRLR